MHRKFVTTCAALAVVLPLAFQAALADGLDTLKAIAQGAKVLQEKMGQGTGSAPPQPGAGSDDVGVAGAVDESALKRARTKMDVLGVRMGMPLDEALRSLKAHNPKLKLVNIQAQRFTDADNKPHPVLYLLMTGERPRAKEQVYLMLSLPPHQRVVHIDRQVQYEKNEASTRASVLGALQNKYGETAVQHGNSDDISQLLWFVGRQPSERAACEGMSLRMAGWGLSGGRDRLRKGCGIVLRAGVREFRDNPSLVTELTVSLDDHILASQDLEDANRYFASAEKNRDKVEIEDATKRGGPKL